MPIIRSTLRQHIPTAAVSAALLALALAQGGYGLGVRSALGIVAWWAVILCAALGVWPERLPRAALVAGGLLAALCVLIGLSALWADSAERAFVEFARASGYAGVFALVLVVARPGQAAALGDGLAIAIGAVALLALAHRLFPDLLPAGDLPAFLPGTEKRLSYPLNYWNGLGIFLALGIPLLLRPALAAGHAALRGAALGVLPALLVAMYLTSSRGGIAAAVAATLVFVLVCGRPAGALAALGVALAGGALAVAVIEARPAITDGPFDSAAASDQGLTAAILILLICVGAGLAHAWLSGRVPGTVPIGRPLARGLLLAGLVVVLAGAVAADPSERLQDFKRPPNDIAESQADFVRTHLLSGGGSGRWQFWGEALDEWQSRPLFGRGAGSWEAWWLEHAPISFYARDAHSLYLETLGELGLVGALLLLGALGSGAAAGVARVRATAGESRVALAGIAGAFAGFTVGAALDWVWELAAVGVVGIVCLALLTGWATLPSEVAEVASGRPLRRGVRAAVAVAGALLICAIALPWLVQRDVRVSQQAAADGELAEALDHALDAQVLQPWASSPRLQVALVREAQGDLAGARDDIAEALERDDHDWRLWLVSSRLAAKQGDVRAAEAALREARRLNPRSPLFARQPDGADGFPEQPEAGSPSDTNSP